MPRQAYNLSRQRTECFTTTINGLLTYYAMRKRDVRTGAIDQSTYEADRQAIGHVLRRIGYTGDMEASARDFRRVTVFRRNQLRTLILDALRRSQKPMTARQIAKAIICVGHDWDLSELELASRVAKACLRMPDGAVRKGTDGKGNVIWMV